ncbi:MAG TPA: RsmD family RNA methyltransferase [Saprospiraceae bacterium]|nr:RsmD family RNA methyltransferase [Saprospiraceae bacterium]
MRISGGEFKGQVFHPKADHWPTRPTTEISREALFNILTNVLDFEACHYLDLFGGTGAHCFEMLSRGCRSLVYVDLYKPAVQFVRQTLKQMQMDSCVQLHQMDYKKYIQTSHSTFDYIFAGPPYPLKEIPEIPDLIFQYQLLKTNGIFVLEHHQAHRFETHPRFWQLRTYGQTHFSFFNQKEL